MHYFYQKMGWATFWALFLPTHLVALSSGVLAAGERNVSGLPI
jgi:hypothetical protein